MKRTLIRAAMATAFVGTLSACGGGNNDRGEDVVLTPPPPAPPVVVAPPPFMVAMAGIETLGASFVGFFRGDANTEPRDPAEGDLPPISFTTEPAEITGT